MRFFHRPNLIREVRGGFTLIELLLTLAVLVLLSAISWPALRQPLADQRLRSAAEQIRTAWTEARLAARSSGRTYVFEYEVDSGTYQVRPYDDEDSSELSEEDTAGLFSSIVDAGDQKLPDGAVFTEAQMDEDSQGNAAQEETRSSAGNTSQETSPILFFPDGSTSEVEMVVTSDDQRQIVVRMRGLTGSVSLSKISAVDEATR